MDQLEDPLRLQQISQPVLAEVAKVGPGRKSATGQLLDGLGEENLSTISCRQEPREPIERGRKVVAACIRGGLPRMQRHPHPQWAELAPVLGQERALAGQGGPQRVFRGPKRRLGAVTNGLVEHPVVGGNQALQDGQLPIDACRMAGGSRSQSAVLPSMSVKRKVTVL